ncbi:suppressor of fused domain protein [Actinoplanes bogorensis]|uniref:Suppressor of fused domain protein n=1 Tax=Paractinoplanes bogorensis TaxID=1610840 RepID=A0ABS5YNX5_9ACTN|nr:suppressor of fused domain protein [Actinoplanes bogorensis]MBU2665157.1 suppressor of fused domain protein [Actinoplanes bogorensis]
MTDDEAPGWDAIDNRLATFYPGVEPKHFGTLHRFALGGPDPLDGVSFYPRPDHWHLVGYGMSELYTKETSDPEVSGWGFELTFRVARAAGEDEPPMWAANLLQNLARYVVSSGNWFEPGHHMNANGPIHHGYDTAMTALAFAEDPELGTIDTPHGRLQFVQVVGLTGDEYAAALAWDTHGLLGLLAGRDPLLVTDPDRRSSLEDPEVRAAVEAGRERDGSSTGMLMLGGFDWVADGTAVRLRVKTITAKGLTEGVRDRLPYGRTLILQGPDRRAVLIPAERYAVRQPEEDVLELDLPPAAVAGLVAGDQVLAGTDRVEVEVFDD